MANEIKRRDLAKQFESIVKQEIKNFNDTTLNFSFSIGKLKEDLSVLTSTLQAFIPAQQAITDHVLNEFNEHKTYTDEILNRQQLVIDTLSFQLENAHKSLATILKKHEEVFLEKVDFHENLQYWGKTIKDLQERQDTNKELFALDLRLLQGSLKEEDEKIRKEVMDLPDKTIELRKEFMDKVDCCHVDKDGVLKELRVYKQEIYLLQRHIEYLMDKLKSLPKDK